MIQKLAIVGVVALLAIAGIVYFFFHMYQNDMQALSAFLAAYDQYDQAVSEFSKPVLASPSGNPSGAAEQNAQSALELLNTRSGVRISSLVKNEQTCMSLMQEIASLSGKEFAALKAYQQAAASQNGDLQALARNVADLTRQRQDDYARFKDLGK